SDSCWVLALVGHIPDRLCGATLAGRGAERNEGLTSDHPIARHCIAALESGSSVFGKVFVNSNRSDWLGACVTASRGGGKQSVSRPNGKKHRTRLSGVDFGDAL